MCRRFREMLHAARIAYAQVGIVSRNGTLAPKVLNIVPTTYTIGFHTGMVHTSTGKIPDTVSNLSLLLLIFFIGRYYCYLPTCIVGEE